MKCNLKGNIKGYAALATGQVNVGDLKLSLMSRKKVLEAFSDMSNLVNSENFREDVRNQKLLKTALSKIKELAEHGLIVLPGKNEISTAAANFLNKVVIDRQSTIDFLNALPFMESDLRIENGIIVSNLTADELNSRIQKIFGTTINESELKYFATSPTTGGLLINSRIQNDVNRHLYTTYLSNVASLADRALMDDPTTPQDFKDATRELKEGPVLSNLYKKLNTLQNRLKQAAADNNPIEAAQARTEWAKTKDRINKVKGSQSISIQVNELKDMYNEINVAISSSKHLSPEDILLYSRQLQLIINAAKLKDENPIFTREDLKDKNLIKTLQELRDDAETIEARLDTIKVSVLRKDTKKVLKNAGKDTDFLLIKNMVGDLRRLAQGVLGIRQIDSTILSYIGELVKTSLVKASILGRKMNNPITTLHESMVASGFDTSKFSQRADGDITGRIVDVFSAKYYRTRKSLTKGSERAKNMVDFNPEILFEKPKNDAGRLTLEKELKTSLGEYMYAKNIAHARSLWEGYNESLTAFKASVANDKDKNTKIAEFENTNSPMKRIENQGRTKNSGTDRFLVSIPRRLDVFGKPTGLYDETYKEIENHPEAMAFYKEVRDAHIANQIRLNRPDEIFKPPHLGFISKKAGELMGEGKYKEALAMTVKGVSSDFDTEGLIDRKMPTDPVTGEFQPKLASELHSISDEINNRYTKALLEDTIYQNLTLKPKDITVEAEMLKYRNRVLSEVAKQVESERSGDILQSVVLNNYAIVNLIEKKAIESQVLLAVQIFKQKVTATGDNEESLKKAKDMAAEVLDHFLNVKYYNYKDLGKATGIKVLGKDITDRNTANVLRKVMLYTYMGWSASVAVVNFLQAQFSNALQAIDGKYFSVKDLYVTGYGRIGESKMRKIIDNMYITGDLAFEFEKLNIHKKKSWKRFFTPMYMQTSVEKVNQGAIALAIMKNVVVTNTTTGEETNMLDAIDDDGNLPDNFTSKEFPNITGVDLAAKVVVSRIDPVIARSNGDFKSPMVVEKNAILRLTQIFTKFLPEMVADRLGERRLDHSLGEEVEGRYRSLYRDIRNKFDKNKTSDELTRRNARTARFEIGLALLAKLSYFLLLKGACDTEECKNQRPAIITAMNLVGKATDDVFNVMATPLAVVEKVTSPFAAESLFTNWFTVMNDAGMLLIPGGDNGRFKKKTDAYLKGDAKLNKSYKKVIPLLSTTLGRYETIANKVRPATFYSNYVWSDND